MSRYVQRAREALERSPTGGAIPTEAPRESAVSAVSAVSSPLARAAEPPAPICLTCRRRPTTPTTGYRCPQCVERAHKLCADWRPGGAPIIVGSNDEETDES